jgi:hypothetical protein
VELEPGDSALWRLGIYGRYQVRKLEIPARLLTAGENELSLRVPSSRAWLMYDFLRLEETDGGKP